MNKDGFTLVELLAVIIILAIIALIATPVITELIDNARKESFKDSAYGLVKASELTYSNDIIDQNVDQLVFIYQDGVETAIPSDKKLNYNGDKPDSGRIIVNDKGQVAIAVYNGQYCAEKDYNDSRVSISTKTKTECTVKIPVTVAVRSLLPVTNTCNPDNENSSCFGEIVLLPFSYSIEGYMRCDGRILPVAQNSALFALIGNVYGGDGVTNFALPNLTGVSPLAGLSYYINVSGATPDWNNGAPVVSSNFNYLSYKSSHDDYLISEVRLAKNATESDNNMILCDGRLLSIASYPALFAVFGTTFGGNGTTIFAVPNLSSATSPVDGLNYYVVVSGIYPTRD